MQSAKYKVIYADPPWNFKTRSAKGLEGRPQHYDRMSIKDICALPVQDWSAKDCHLFMWTTGPHLEKAFRVINSWGFKYSGMGFVWIKLNKNAKPLLFPQWGSNKLKEAWTFDDLFMGGGYTTRKNAEFCLLARKGSPKRLSKKVHEVIISPRREHSRKPDEAYDRIKEYADGPYLEMFARSMRHKWDQMGDQVFKFGEV